MALERAIGENARLTRGAANSLAGQALGDLTQDKCSPDGDWDTEHVRQKRGREEAGDFRKDPDVLQQGQAVHANND
ncbi:MAG: hypothetical protein WC684_03560, partial [Hyphomicrobium sp.]